MKIYRGTNPANPIELTVSFLSDVTEKVGQVLNQIFGNKDGAYFIKSEYYAATRKTDTFKTYIVYVEDMDKENHLIHFKVTIK